jgi:hypothetical protein
MITPGLLAGAIVVVAACTTDYQQGKGDPNYGLANALADQQPPGTTAEFTQDGGKTTGVVVGAALKCGTPVDAGACAVSFKTDVLGAFGLANCASASCHGGATPRNVPRIEPSEAPSMYQAFQAFTISTGQPYINPCSTDGTKSGMACNLVAAGAAGGCGVHMPQGAQMPADAIAKINTWLKCGSPNN